MTYQKGFTLIELLVVITILGVMAAIGLTSFQTANMKARDSRRAADVQQLMSALEMYKTDEGEYPTTGEGLGVLTVYMSGRNVVDPKTKQNYTYVSPSVDPDYEYDLSYTKEIDGNVQLFHNP